MSKVSNRVAAFVAICIGFSPALGSANILQDGTFLQPIGTGSNLTPWSDWTAAGITRLSGGADEPGNFARIPAGGDLFQRFSPLSNGQYQISFDVRNDASWSSTLVFSVQQILGTPIDLAFAKGFASQLVLQPTSGWLHILFGFKVDNPGFPVNEFYFSNSYDYATGPIAGSVNPAGTLIDVANVSLSSVSNAPAPIPGSGILSLLSVAALRLRRFVRGRRLAA